MNFKNKLTGLVISQEDYNRLDEEQQAYYTDTVLPVNEVFITEEDMLKYVGA